MKKSFLVVLALVFAVSVFAGNVNTNYENYDLAPGVIPQNVPQVDELWDFQYEYFAEVQTGDNGLLGIEFDGTNIWISGRSVTAANQIYLLDPYTGLYVSQFPTGTTSAWGVRDMCHDGTYIYGGEDSGLHCFDPVTQTNIMTLSWPAGMSFPRANTYDPATDHFYGGNFGLTCYEMDRQGGLIRSFAPAPLTAVYGMAWDDLAPDGPWLWVIDQTNPSSGCNWHKMDPTTLTYVTPSEIHVLNPPTSAGPISGGGEMVTGIDPQFASFLSFGQGTPDNGARWEGYIVGPPPPPMNVTVTLAPVGMPIVIPATGGTFEFNIEIQNNETSTVLTDIWSEVILPGGSTYGPLINVPNMNFAAGFNGDRDRNQIVPAGAPAGTYTYMAYTGMYPNSVWDDDEFDFVKSAADNGGPIFNEWANWGESFEDMIGEATVATPETFTLHNAYPNPFNPTSTISYELSETANVQLTVFDVNGRVVSTLADGMLPAGSYAHTFNAHNLASGVYFYKLTVDNMTETKKIILMK